MTRRKTTTQERRIRAVMRKIGDPCAIPWVPKGRQRHMKRWGCSQSTADRDFEKAFDRKWNARWARQRAAEADLELKRLDEDRAWKRDIERMAERREEAREAEDKAMEGGEV